MGLATVNGILDYPLSKEKVTLELTDEKKTEVEEILARIRTIVQSLYPPPPEQKSYCRKCAYFEFCWV